MPLLQRPRYELRTNGTDAVTEMESDATDGSTTLASDIGAGFGLVHPSSCFMFTYTLPDTDTMLRITPTCASRFDDNITTGYDDSLLLYVVMGGEDEFLCDADVAARYTPVLTSEDWIEPISGRRYMCYEFVDEGQAYSVLTMSLGNAPCDGPKPQPTPSPTPFSPPSPSTSTGTCPGGHFTMSFAVPVVVAMLAAFVSI